MIRYSLSIAFSLILMSASDAFAQRVPNFTRRSTISPYISLFNNNQSGINNYFTLVRPMQQQARINQQQAVDNRFLEQQILAGRAQTQAGVQSSMLRPTTGLGIGQPAAHASYFNYSHYFNAPVNMRQSLAPIIRRR